MTVTRHYTTAVAVEVWVGSEFATVDLAAVVTVQAWICAPLRCRIPVTISIVVNTFRGRPGVLA